MKRLIYIAIGAVIALLGNHYFITSKKPDLQRLYMRSMAIEDQPPVVFIHGILGSKLKDRMTDRELWFGSLWKLLFDEHEDLALRIDPGTLEPIPVGLTAFAIAENTAGKDYYGRIFTDPGGAGRLCKSAARTGNPAGVEVFLYVLLRLALDNAVNAAHLADFIEQIRQDFDNPDLKVDIVAHSMGGLIARYYIRYGRTDVLGSNDFSGQYVRCGKGQTDYSAGDAQPGFGGNPERVYRRDQAGFLTD